MKNSLPAIMVLCATLAVAFSSCSKKIDAQTELERASSLFEKDKTAPITEVQPLQSAPGPSAVVSPSQQMNQAVAAYKGGNLEDAVRRLQSLRATPAMSPEQGMAVNDAMAAVMGEIYAMAAKGDARAIQASKQYEKMQTQSR